MMEIKTNCFAYDCKKNECKALKTLECEKCKFYKTYEQNKLDEINAKIKVEAK